MFWYEEICNIVVVRELVVPIVVEAQLIKDELSRIFGTIALAIANFGHGLGNST